jgi:dTMP kinase
MFIVVDGIDGSGKTAISKMLTLFFESLGEKVTLTREPNGDFRNLILGKLIHEVCNKASLLAFLSNRAYHIKNIIKPALDRGDIVICDRFCASTHAYLYSEDFNDPQFIPQCQIKTLNDFVIDVEPDIELIVDVTPENAIEHIKSRGDVPQPLEFLQRVSYGYQYYLGSRLYGKSRAVSVDGNCNLSTLMYNVLRVLQKELDTFGWNYLASIPDHAISIISDILVNWFFEKEVHYAEYPQGENNDTAGE